MGKNSACSLPVKQYAKAKKSNSESIKIVGFSGPVRPNPYGQASDSDEDYTCYDTRQNIGNHENGDYRSIGGNSKRWSKNRHKRWDGSLNNWDDVYLGVSQYDDDNPSSTLVDVTPYTLKSRQKTTIYERVCIRRKYLIHVLLLLLQLMIFTAFTCYWYRTDRYYDVYRGAVDCPCICSENKTTSLP
ncbi:membrane protein V1 [Spheniscid alphaherpesvirus 1]|uniref:Membrane protein V1 n=1 Tax=Spheniscid alphaherpesvirus 1 TaxID=2560777 RepID=A0A1R3TEI5_9ALPH|nr:membrane protein V1 [Spheniscid alphaherpesvirus 1]SCO83481.1 membrane protein V1 [Spheniscid alphaherpesvirus 1]